MIRLAEFYLCSFFLKIDFNMLFGTLIGIVLGGFITWIVSRYYYKKAGNELLNESRKLKLMSDLIIYKLQYPDTPTEIKRDTNGDVTGLIVRMSTKKKDNK
jgi:hypothetical protein